MRAAWLARLVGLSPDAEDEELLAELDAMPCDQKPAWSKVTPDETDEPDE